MNNMARISPAMTAAVVIGLLLSFPNAGASGGITDRQTDRFRGTVNTAGEIRDPSGNVVGRVLMTTPGVAFDLAKMSISANGNVLDPHGATVGRLVLSDERRAELPASGTGVLVDRAGNNAIRESGTVQNIQDFARGARQPAEQMSGEFIREQPAVKESARREPAHRQSSRQSGSILMGTREADLNARRERVESRIRTELAEGRITDEQAAELGDELAAADRTEADYKRDGVLKDREILSLYKKWDRIMARLDEYLGRNARSAIGLRTK